MLLIHWSKALNNKILQEQGVHGCCSVANRLLLFKVGLQTAIQSLSHVQLFATQHYGLQHARLSCSSLFPSSNRHAQIHVHWVGNATQPSHPVTPFSSCLQTFPASGTFPISQLFASDGQSIGASASAPVLPMHIQDWFPSELTGLISLQSNELSRVFSSTTIWRHQFLGDCQSWVALHGMAHSFIELLQAPLPQQGCDPWRGVYMDAIC